MSNTPTTINVQISPKSRSLGITAHTNAYHGLSYISTINSSSPIWHSLPSKLRFNVWILAVDDVIPSTAHQLITTLQDKQVRGKITTVSLLIAKRSEEDKSKIQEYKSIFHHLQTNQRPIAAALISSPLKPISPAHIGQLSINKHKTTWIQAIFNEYDKMHNSCTFSPFSSSKQ